METLFGIGEDRLRRRAAQPSVTGSPIPDLSRYYRVLSSSDPEELGDRLRALAVIEAAYVRPLPQPTDGLETTPAVGEAPPVTPDFSSMQGYLNSATHGIDAWFAWTLPGGEGGGVGVIDVGGGWNFGHEDVRRGSGGVLIGQGNSDWINQGTAVAGVLAGERNGLGVTGICPQARMRAASIFGPGSSGPEAIRLGADVVGRAR